MAIAMDVCGHSMMDGSFVANRSGVRVNKLFHPTPEESSGAAGDAPGGPTTKPNAATPATAPAIPKAAAIVANGEVTEDALKLRKDLDDERAARKKVEIEHASVTDELQRLKDATDARNQPANVPIKKKSPEEKPFRLGRFV